MGEIKGTLASPTCCSKSFSLQHDWEFETDVDFLYRGFGLKISAIVCNLNGCNYSGSLKISFSYTVFNLAIVRNASNMLSPFLMQVSAMERIVA